MKILKKVVIVIIALVVLISVVSLFFPSDIDVKRSIVINTAVEQVFPNVNSMDNWRKWGGPWHEDGMDFTKVIQRTEGSEYGVGSRLIYDQGDGEGSVEIIESDDNERIKTCIAFADAGYATGEWFFEPSPNSTKVTWTLHVALGYNPLKRIIGNLLLGDKVGPVFETGLTNLKKVSEN